MGKVKGLALLAVTGLSACGTLRERGEQVRVTASASVVADCAQKGSVALGSAPTAGYGDNGLLELRKQAIERGGNVLLVRSYAAPDGGTAYFCDPLPPADDPRIKPPGNPGG